MRLNGEHFRWVSGAPQRQREVNAFTIVAHEAGHYFGLGHSQYRDAVMYASYQNGVGSITSDDAEGICAVYPGGGGGIVADEPCEKTGCADGFMCEGGTCKPEPGQTPDPPKPDEPDEPGRDDDDGQRPGAAGFGDACDSGSDCARNVCIGTGGQPFCTALCRQAADCPAGWRCRSNGIISACLPDPDADEPGDADDADDGNDDGDDDGPASDEDDGDERDDAEGDDPDDPVSVADDDDGAQQGGRDEDDRRRDADEDGDGDDDGAGGRGDGDAAAGDAKGGCSMAGRPACTPLLGWLLVAGALMWPRRRASGTR